MVEGCLRLYKKHASLGCIRSPGCCRGEVTRPRRDQHTNQIAGTDPDMLTLSLLRHAKSDWSLPGQGDFDRGLAPRGREAAPRMGAWMRANGVTPELVLCSTAVRARQTLDLVLPRLEGQPKVIFDGKLYLASPVVMLERLRAAAGEARHVLMVGHDPGMHQFAVALAGTGEAGVLSAVRAKFPTAGLAVVTFDVEDWSEVTTGGGQLVCFMSPKRLV